ncbi:BNR repeat-containing protein [Duganella radicis]|uniref:BNR repeat-containing protein n=1 Tax=Duganella radicis TaxID=551988 RepID=UPI0035314BDE
MSSLLLAACQHLPAAPQGSVSAVGPGWANNSVNTVIFRQNSLVSHAGVQYIAYYDQERFVVLGKRQAGSQAWTLRRTPYQGHADDAHNAISIMVDGAGYLHMAWDHHNHPLHYARSVRPGSLELSQPMAMTGMDEASVSYPQFFSMPDGGLLFFYRNGASGKGNLVLNRYDPASGAWRRLADNLIGGEGRRSAYWQACVDHHGTIHVSWVWRESPDVGSNHDLAYARSRDGGRSWERSSGQAYTLPITAASAEYAARIPQHSDLINQTSMAADRQGRPYIAGYWRDADSAVPQYRIVHLTGQGWRTLSLNFRKTPFSLAGGGTKAIPISRPQLVLDGGAQPAGWMLFRDAERGDRVSVAAITDFAAGRYTLADLTTDAYGAWEPGYDTELWRDSGMLHVFLQRVSQVDGEGLARQPPSQVQVLAWQPGAGR